MTNLIEDWLNNEVKLSRKILNIDEDFKNGYLFGELLHRYQQISNFNEYKNKDDQETKLSNLKNVETSLRELNIKLEKGRIFDVLNQKKGVAARFLYQIKMMLSKKSINFESLMAKRAPDASQTYSRSMYPRSKLESSANKKENLSSSKIINQNSILENSNTNFFQIHKNIKNIKLPSINVENQILPRNRINSSINSSTRNKGDVINLIPTINTNNNFFLNPLATGNKFNNNKTEYLSKLNSNFKDNENSFYLDPIKRFEEFQKMQTQRIIKDENKQNQYLKVEQLRNKQKIRSQEKEFQIKKIKADEVQNENWLKAIEIKNNFEKKVEDEKNLLSNNYKKLVVESIYKHEKNSMIEVEKFEKNLSKLGLDLTVLDPKLKKTGKNFISSEMMLQKIKEKISETEKAKKERERRKRKILNDQNKIQLELQMRNISSPEKILNNKGFYSTESYLQLNNDSVLAKRLEYEKVRDLHSRDVNREMQRRKNEEMFRKETENVQAPTRNNQVSSNSLEKNEYYFTDDFKQNEGFRSNRNLMNENQKFVKDIFFEELYKENLQKCKKNLQLKITKRNKNKPLMQQLSNYLIDFVEEIFNFQTENNVDQIPLKQWTEYATMFINNKPFNNVKSISSNYFDDPVTTHTEYSKNNINNLNNLNILNNYNNNLILEEEDENSLFKPSYMQNNNNNTNKDLDFNLLNMNENNLSFKDSLSKEKHNRLKSSKNRHSKDSSDNESVLYVNIDNYTPFAPEIFEENELFDYVHFLGDYKESVIPSEVLNKMLDYSEVMRITANPTGKKSVAFNLKNTYGNAGKSDANQLLSNNILYADYELKDEDIENLTIPQAYSKNYYLSDVVSIILDLKFKENYAANSSSNVITLNNQKIIVNANNNNNNNLTEESENQLAHIPLKISVLGKDFSGKKTQLKLLSESFNLKIYNIEELIAKNLEIMEKLEIPLDQNPKYKTLKKADIEKFMAERHVEEQRIESIKDLLLKIRECIKDEKEIEDDLQIEFLIANIKTDFPDKPDDKLIEELSAKLKRKKEIMDELAKIKEEKYASANALTNPTPKEKEKKNAKDTKDANNNLKNSDAHLNALTQELQKLNFESNKGFALVNFPKTISQAKKFEKKICSYVPEIEKPKNKFDYVKDCLFILLDRIQKPENTQKNLLSAFDSLFYLEIENEEIIRRAKNRKLDPTTGIVYHMEDNPPPSDDKKLNERLQSLDEHLNIEQLRTSLFKFDEEFNKLKSFYSPFVNIFTKLNLHFSIFNKINLSEFIFEINKQNNLNQLLNNTETENNLHTNDNNNNLVKHTVTSGAGGKSTTNLANVNKEKDKEYKLQMNLIKSVIEKALKQVIEINEEKENQIYEKFLFENQKDNSNINNATGTNLTNNNMQIMSNSSMNSKHVTIQIPKDANSNSNNLNNLNVSRGSSFRRENVNTPNTNNNLNVNNNNNNNQTQRSNLNHKENYSSNNLPNLVTNNLNNNFNSNNHNSNNLNLLIDPANSFSNINNSNIQANLFLEEHFINYNKKFEEAKRKLSMGVTEKIFGDWAKIYEIFTRSVKQIFRSSHKQKESIVSNFNKVQEKFIDFLKRPSEKASYVAKLQAKYNKFVEEYPQLKSDEKVKEEFHQDVCEVEDRVWEIIQNRKKDSIEERQKIMECGYIEKEVEKFYKNYLERLFVLETEKFYGSILVLRDFYSNLDMKITTEFFTFKPLEILLDADLEKQPIFNKSTFYGANINGNKDFNTTNLDADSKQNDKMFDSPKIEKLYKNCIKILIKYDEIKKGYEKNLKSQYQYNMSISSDSLAIRKASKAIKKTPNQDSIFSDERRDMLFFEEELKSAIKQEKNKYKYRITFLKYWGLNYLRKVKDLCRTIYDKLDDWIINTIKMENEAMNALTGYFDVCIEKEIKMKADKELDVFDIYRPADAKDYFEISSNSEELPFRELDEKTSTDFDKFLNIFYEIQSYEVYPGYIRTQTFKDIFICKNFLEFKSTGIPSIFKFLSSYNFNKLLKNLENVPLYHSEEANDGLFKKITFNDVINVKQIFTILLVIESKIINENNLNSINKQAEQCLIRDKYLNKEDFMKIEFWFEKDPSVNLKTFTEEFVMPSKVKQIIFEINKEDNEMIDLFNLLEIYKLNALQNTPNLEELAKSNRTYGEYLFL